jgi:hypothetical protein
MSVWSYAAELNSISPQPYNLSPVSAVSKRRPASTKHRVHHLSAASLGRIIFVCLIQALQQLVPAERATHIRRKSLHRMDHNLCTAGLGIAPECLYHANCKRYGVDALGLLTKRSRV